MTDDEILDRITGMMRDLTGDDDLVLARDTAPDEVEKWDSLLHVRLVVTIEAEFGVRFDVEEIGEPENVAEMIALIREKLDRA